MMNTTVIKEETLKLLQEKFFTQPNKFETSEKYKTFFPAMKYYRFLAGKVDAIRIAKECYFPEKDVPLWNGSVKYKEGEYKRSFFCVWAGYWNEEKTKHYNIICIYNNLIRDRAQKGLSSILSDFILKQIREDQEENE